MSNRVIFQGGSADNRGSTGGYGAGHTKYVYPVACRVLLTRPPASSGSSSISSGLRGSSVELLHVLRDLLPSEEWSYPD